MLFYFEQPDDRLAPFQKGERWDKHHVRLPCSPENTFKQRDKDNTSRWSLINVELSVEIKSAFDLENAIKSYNASYRNDWNFFALRELLELHYDQDEKDFFFKKLLPKLIHLALCLPELIKCPIPLLTQGSNRSISMSKHQVACLLANAFLCTFPMRNTRSRNSEYSSYPKINFNRLFQSEGDNVIQKLKCIVNYFRRVLFVEMPQNAITFQRQCIREGPEWDKSDILIANTKLRIQSAGRIEEAEGMLQVDFANKFVGGGVLSQGCVQEEIRFVISPELIVARLFTECLGDNEALIVLGCEQFSAYRGYAASFKYAGDFVDTTPIDLFRRRNSKLVAIDAIAYNLPHEQFDDVAVLRDINKAFAGFFCDDENKAPIASGLWGCGAFNGDPVRSAMIQLIACTQSGRNLAFYTSKDQILESKLEELFEFFVANKTTVALLYKALKSYRYRGQPDDLVPYIKHRCGLEKYQFDSAHKVPE